MGKMRMWLQSFYVDNNSENIRLLLVETINNLESALLAVGLTRTTDVNQLIKAESITIANVKPQYYGFRIYEMNDSLHSNSPIFIKIEFTAAGSANLSDKTMVLRLVVSVGSGSDGNGLLLNPSLIVASSDIVDNSNQSGNIILHTGQKKCFVYRGDGILWLMLGTEGYKHSSASSSVKPNVANGSTCIAMIVISRPCDSSGDLLKDGVCVMTNANPTSYGTSGAMFQPQTAYFSFVNLKTGYSSSTKHALVRPLSDTALSIGGAIPFSRLYGYFGDGQMRQLSGVASASASQVASGDEVEIVLEGAIAKSYIIPSREAKGFQEVFDTRDSRNYDNSPAFDTPVLAWGGEYV